MKPIQVREVSIPAAGAMLEGTLELPEQPRGLVIFAHGSGSSRHSPRNRTVASVLHQADIGTLLFDLLTPDEDRERAARFDIAHLAKRLVQATTWTRVEAPTRALAVGYFGASTGAAAALVAASQPHAGIAAIVSRGGRPDLAGADALRRVTAPTLLVVGGDDTAVIAMNKQALAAMTCTARLVIVPRATHLFEEPGALEQVSVAARDWFHRYLDAAAHAT
jgi:pimeloyl-ACP methyl ester carboxylesterase